MAAGSKYPDETRAAVMAALLAGQSIPAVAAQHHIPPGTIKHWSAQLHQEPVQPVEPEKRSQIGDLLLRFLTCELEALIAQAKVFADAEWLKKQPASEIAILHGVGADKAFRLLEALDSGPAEEP